MPKKKKIFISYSRKDIEVTNYLATELRKRGVDVFVDYQKLIAGTNFMENIALEIEKSDYFIFLISPNSVASKWVAGEVTWAVENEITIIPVLLEPI